jgi:hypothetical protein
MSSQQHVYEIRPRKDRRGFDLIGDRLPLGLLWFEGPDAIGDAVNYARFFSRSHPAIIRVLDESGTVAETLELAGDCSQVVNINSVGHGCGEGGGSGHSFFNLPLLCAPTPATLCAASRSPVVSPLPRKRVRRRRVPSRRLSSSKRPQH